MANMQADDTAAPTAPEPVIVIIDDETFTADDALVCNDRASNSAYHRMGKPTWWARYDGATGKRFLAIPKIRADYDVKIDAELIAEALRECGPGQLVLGYGKHPSRDACRVTFTVTSPNE